MKWERKMENYLKSIWHQARRSDLKERRRLERKYWVLYRTYRKHREILHDLRHL